MGLAKKIKDKVAYERESYRLSGEHLQKLAQENPQQWRREQRKRK